jgi:hypothetical protein
MLIWGVAGFFAVTQADSQRTSIMAARRKSNIVLFSGWLCFRQLIILMFDNKVRILILPSQNHVCDNSENDYSL